MNNNRNLKVSVVALLVLCSGLMGYLAERVQSYNTLSRDAAVCVQPDECIQYVRGVLSNGK